MPGMMITASSWTTWLIAPAPRFCAAWIATGLYSMKKPIRFLRRREKKLVAATYCSVSALIIDMYETTLWSDIASPSSTA